MPPPSSSSRPPDTRPLWRVFLVFLGPMVLSNVLQALSGTFNNVFIGQMLGTRALAAVASVFPVVFFLISLVIGVGAGASVLIGQAWGARETHKVKAIAGTALAVCLVLGVVIALLGGLFTEGMLKLLRTPPEVLPEALGYARLMMWAMPGLLVYILSTALMRGVGDTVTPLLTLTLSTAVSAVLTPAFIRGWWGLPMLGVTSAAAASICAFLIALTGLTLYMRWRKHPLAPDMEMLRALRIDLKLLKLVLKIGLPTGLQVIVMSLAEIALLALVNSFGPDATAAYGAVNQVVNYVQFPALSIAITSSILGAQAIGAGRADRLGAIARTGLQMNVLLTGGLVLLGYALSRDLLGLFITSQPVVELAQTLLHVMLWGSIIYGFAAVLSGVMRASGAVIVPTALSITAIAAVEVPSAYALAGHFGITGVWMAYPIAFLTMLVLQAGYYQLIWRKRKIVRLV
ncbi:MATE family efflux transporter [Paucibacter sp. R3-3]|uniref:MATE family efflux transporter n=1 Tax=Roseateles agri TaxID=3098619 RepID=A0ABU5DL94_9BURK|nr:MATE family efflux transporter [Paucibacter sp. R3-3]MDY0746506.1 MATE family efflux transporter [Paucibacter sp. R3-3]